MVSENMGHTNEGDNGMEQNEMRIESDSNEKTKKDDKMEIPPHRDVLKMRMEA
ncbi:hypothetical protein AAG906_020045 [Vitis piasezkii]